MEQPPTPPPWLPAPRPPAPVDPRVSPQPVGRPETTPPPDDPGTPRRNSGPGFPWRRILRSPRGAAGLAVLAAALLLWPFAGLSWIPWLVGLGALVVLRLLRLDGLLRGWDLPLAGLVVVAGLMVSTSPWAWALAASIGVLLAGLLRLPWWRLAAVGAVMCVVSGVGFALSTVETVETARRIEARAGDPLRVQLGEARPERVLPAIVQAVELDDADPVCRLLTPPAEAQLLRALGAADCDAAVAELHRRIGPGASTDQRTLPQPVPTGDTWTVDACASPWAAAAGPALGRITVARTGPAVQRFAVAGFASCATP